jgi:hypothetical protein
MVRFQDYHRTIIGYHGTRLSVALDVVNRKREINSSRNPDDWLGHGVYFWKYAPQQALWWARRRASRYHWGEPIAILGSMIRLGFCFDLLDPYNAIYLKSIHDRYREARESASFPVPKNGHHRRFLDCAVFQYAYATIEENQGQKTIDSARAVYVPTDKNKRIYPTSWLPTEAHIQICVRNPACILGTWLHHPTSLETDNGAQAAENAEIRIEPQDQAGGGPPEQDVDGGSDSAHGEGGIADPGASGRSEG